MSFIRKLNQHENNIDWHFHMHTEIQYISNKYFRFTNKKQTMQHILLFTTDFGHVKFHASLRQISSEWLAFLRGLQRVA